ncbi:MAG: DUF3626 domain-containing protein [Actinobacteria bacterium]|nr:MAG: DUF3626 domain-containing protein [Actinomycetota bacterium]
MSRVRPGALSVGCRSAELVEVGSDRAVDVVRNRALRARSEAFSRWNHLIDADRFGQLEAWALRLAAAGRVTLNFHPDRIAASAVTVSAGLLEEGRYRSQWVTGISNGSRSAVPGGERGSTRRIPPVRIELSRSRTGRAASYHALRRRQPSRSPRRRDVRCAVESSRRARGTGRGRVVTGPRTRPRRPARRARRRDRVMRREPSPRRLRRSASAWWGRSRLRCRCNRARPVFRRNRHGRRHHGRRASVRVRGPMARRLEPRSGQRPERLPRADHATAGSTSGSPRSCCGCAFYRERGAARASRTTSGGRRPTRERSPAAQVSVAHPARPWA